MSLHIYFTAMNSSDYMIRPEVQSQPCRTLPTRMNAGFFRSRIDAMMIVAAGATKGKIVHQAALLFPGLLA